MRSEAIEWDNDDDDDQSVMPTAEELFRIMDNARFDEACAAHAEEQRRATLKRPIADFASTIPASFPTSSSALSFNERVRSTDPAVHACIGMRCPFIETNRDQTYVCSVTGICWSQQSFNDPFTAGIVSTIDDNGVQTGGVDSRSTSRRRRDPRLASEQAMIAAHAIERAERIEAATAAAHDVALVTASSDAVALQTPSSRVETSPAIASKEHTTAIPQRCRLRHALNAEKIAALRRDAQDMLDKLTSPRQPTMKRLAVPPPPGTSTPAAIEGALRAYIRRCQIAGRMPLLDDLHNIELNMRYAVGAAKAHSDTSHGRLRGLGATLVVALWTCVLRSPYMEHTKRTAGNFRPFAAGVFFSMRRGVALAAGAPALVPRCGALADALPAVRAAYRGTPTHAVHLSHHRGVRTLLRCIASVPADQTANFFADALRAARALETAMAEIGSR